MIYGHGDDLYAYPQGIHANFSSNVWHQGPHSHLLSSLQQAIPALGSYPDPNGDAIRHQLAQKHGLTPQHFILTNGAVEAFYLIAQAWRQTAATIFTPTFSEYEDAVTLHNISLTFLPEEHISDTLGINTPLAFICNPNNPTGRSIPAGTLTKIIEANPHTVFVVDEAYTDFTAAPQTIIHHVNRLPNLILVRAYTKTFAIPGLRVGYIVSQPATASPVAKFKIPWSVNSLALEACRYILENEEQIRPDVHALLAETRWLAGQINQIPSFEAIPADTPFFLVKLKHGTSTALKQYLAENWHCLVRDAANFRGLNTPCIRLATQSREKNTILLNGLYAWTQHTSSSSR